MTYFYLQYGYEGLHSAQPVNLTYYASQNSFQSVAKFPLHFRQIQMQLNVNSDVKLLALDITYIFMQIWYIHYCCRILYNTNHSLLSGVERREQ